MGSFEVGLVLPVSQFGPERTTPRWTEMREMVPVGEEAGRLMRSVAAGSFLGWERVTHGWARRTHLACPNKRSSLDLRRPFR
jgi:hypothetical protein